MRRSTALTKMDKSRARLILDHPFFASLLLSMPFVEDSTTETMATDGETVYFNPDWTDKLTQDETTFVLCHEVGHCMFDHMGRRGARGPNRWNQAADYIVNGVLISEKIGTMPRGGLHNPSLVKSGGETAEGVYALLPESDEQKGTGASGGAMDRVHDAGSKMGQDKPDEAKLEEKRAEMRVRVVAAKNAAKMQGRLSAGLERLIGEVLKPSVDWAGTLRRFLTERAKNEYSYARPKRRLLGSMDDLVLPGLSGVKMGLVVIAVDCSGSICEKTLAVFNAEINKIREDVSPRLTRVIYFDAHVLRQEDFESDEPVTLKPIGGGGTNFAPVFSFASEQDETPSALVMLTDLQCSSFGPAPDYPVLFATTDSTVAPWGEVVEIKGLT